MQQRSVSSRSGTRSARWVAVLLLLALVFTSVAAGVNAQGTRDVANPVQPVSNPPQLAGPDKIIQPQGALPGIYYIDYGNTIWPPSSGYPTNGAIRFIGWSVLNPADNVYNWAELDNWIASRRQKGLGTGIMITTYDGSDNFDIKSTPNFVIKQPNGVLPATYKTSATDTNYANQPHYVNYFRRANANADFEYSPHDSAWTFTGATSLTNFPPAPADVGGSADGYAAMLGGANNATGSVAHTGMTIPAMPPGISPSKTVYVRARIGLETTDPNPNDHLYMELWDASGNKLGGTEVDIHNLSQTSGTWADYEFDVSAFATERAVVVAFRVVTDSSNPTTFYVDNTSLWVRHLIPNYWPDTDAQRTYYKAYKKFIDKLGERYKNNPDLQFVAMGTGVYGENQPTQSDNYPNNHFDHVVELDGKLTQGDWMDFVKQITYDYATAFGNGTGQPARHLFLQYAPSYKSETERTTSTDYASSLGVGLSANFLPVDFPASYKSNLSGFYDPVRRYWTSVPIAFEAYSMDLCNPLMVYWGLFGGLDKHPDYIRTDPTLIADWGGALKPTASYINWAKDYLGKNAQTAPKVWTVMREHMNPMLRNCRANGYLYETSGTWPQLGNFNFFLTQVDSIAGGRTVPETNNKGADSRYAKNPATSGAAPEAGLGNCPITNSYRTDMFGTNYPCFKQPYNPDLPPIVGQDTTLYNIRAWTGVGKEAFVVRRTDQATDNPFMFFRIDDDYMNGSGTQVYRAAITVKYFDMGTDKFSVMYDSSSGEKPAGTVTKTGTKQFKTVTFTVNDARFGNSLPGSSDFYLDSREPGTNAKDGNEWVHMVEVEKLGTDENTPTPSPTPTQTATPTVTPSPTAATGAVEGKAFEDLNGNNKLDAGEPGVAGAEIVLIDYNTDAEAYTTLSGADGSYRFGAVAPGQYTLKEKTAPPGYTKSAYSITFLVQANVTVSLGTNFGHTMLATSTPTVTPTPSNTPPAALDQKIYLPLVIR